MRSQLYERRTGEWTDDWSKKAGAASLVHHEVLLPAGVDPAYRDPGILWNAADAMEKRKDSVTAREIVIPLPRDTALSLDDRVVMAREFAWSHFVSKGIPVQINIHDTGNGNPHAHLLIATRRLTDEGFAPKKALDLDPKVRFIHGRPLVVEAEQWGSEWRDFQNEWFRARGKGITVDPVAPYPGEHIGPKRFRHPRDPRIEEATARQELNTKVARDPKATLDHLRRQQQHFTGSALDRFLEKHVPDPHERTELKHSVVKTGLEEDARADRVASGWRKLNVEDVARELSPEYKRRVAQGRHLSERVIPYAKKMRLRNEAELEEGERQLQGRWDQMGAVRRIAHQLHLHRDHDIERWGKYRDSASRRVERWSIRQKAAQDLLGFVQRRAQMAIDEIRPQAQRELARRQHLAHIAKVELSNLENTPLYQQNNRLRARSL
jgi:hypothetical protein